MTLQVKSDATICNRFRYVLMSRVLYHYGLTSRLLTTVQVKCRCQTPVWYRYELYERTTKAVAAARVSKLVLEEDKTMYRNVLFDGAFICHKESIVTPKTRVSLRTSAE